MWKLIWLLFISPFSAPITGKIMGHRVSRNPLRYISMPLWAASLTLLALLGLCLFPFLIIIQLCSCWWMRRTGHDARFYEGGIEIFSRRFGVITRHPWEEIEALTLEFVPPFWIPQLALISGTTISLQLENWQQLAAVCSEHGIKVEERPPKTTVPSSLVHTMLSATMEMPIEPERHHEIFHFQGGKKS